MKSEMMYDYWLRYRMTNTDRQIVSTWRQMMERTVRESYRRDDGGWDYTNVLCWVEPYRWASIQN